MLLDLLRGISAGQAHLRAGGWHPGAPLPYELFRGPELAGLTVGVIGAGAVGSLVEQRLRAGFGSRVLVHDPCRGDSVPLAELLPACDAVTLHTPPVPVLGAAELALLRPGAYVVNTARSVCCDQDALCAALATGRLGGAALDVFDVEPLPAGSPLLTTPGLLLTPHLAGAASDVVRHHTAMLCADVGRWVRGEPLRHDATARRHDMPEGRQDVPGGPVEG